MTRRELIQKVQEGMTPGELSSRQIAEVIDGVFGAIAEAIREQGGYTHPGFGAFKVKVQGARLGKNPKTGATIELPVSATVAFKPSADLKDSLKP